MERKEVAKAERDPEFVTAVERQIISLPTVQCEERVLEKVKGIEDFKHQDFLRIRRRQ